MLRLENIHNAYGNARVLFGIEFEVLEGQVVTLIGRNGMGKTTTIKSIFGMQPPTGGKILIDGNEFTGSRPHKIAAAGIGLVPDGRRIFSNLTVEENLVSTARRKDGSRWQLNDIYQMFPRLQERRRNMGNQLSGGEQQMLAIGRALMTGPRLLVLDEATEGLAPIIRDEIWHSLSQLKMLGLAILVVDKNIDALLRIADRHVVIEKGRVAWQGTNDALAATPEVAERFLHV
jgi:branched-chain amino acid transport system ATP-binding protein